MEKKKRIVKVVDIVPVEGYERESIPERIEREEPVNPAHYTKEDFDLPLPRREDDEFDMDAEPPAPEEYSARRVSSKTVRWMIMIAAVVVIGVGTAITVLPRADITIVPQKIDWTFKNGVTVRTALNNAVVDPPQIPGELITKRRTAVLQFEATGKKNIQRKAHGTITIINAYSSASQPLVASTRFETPDGKVFRLLEKITVPGAKVVNGKIEPASITAQVAADKAGTEYNVGPLEKFTIPGFAGSDKFAGFYAKSDQPMTGGFVGEAAYPTDDNMAKAKIAVESALREALTSEFTTAIPEELKFVEGASQGFAILTMNVNTETNEQNMFSVAGEAEMSAMVFREADMLSTLHALALKNNSIAQDEFERREYTLAYGEPTVNKAAGTMVVPVEYKTLVAHMVDASAIQTQSQGKSKIQLKEYVMGLPGIERATAKLWPFWVRHVPEKESKVNVTVE